LSLQFGSIPFPETKTTITAVYAVPAANKTLKLALLSVDIETTKTVAATKMIMNLKSILCTTLSPEIGQSSHIWRERGEQKFHYVQKASCRTSKATFRQCTIFRETTGRDVLDRIFGGWALGCMNGSRALAEKRCIIQNETTYIGRQDCQPPNEKLNWFEWWQE
jgi:hypothetical protein